MTEFWTKGAIIAHNQSLEYFLLTHMTAAILCKRGFEEFFVEKGQGLMGKEGGGVDF